MHNVEMFVKDDVLTITVNLKVKGRPSQNDQRTNYVIASTLGTKPVVDENGKFRRESINMSIWRPAEEDEIRAEPCWRDTGW